jgi:hypothetical protein
MNHALPMTTTNNTTATIGSNVSLSSDYCSDNAINANSIFEIVDFNTRWGFRVVLFGLNESGARVRDYSSARWIDRDSIGRVFN